MRMHCGDATTMLMNRFRTEWRRSGIELLREPRGGSIRSEHEWLQIGYRLVDEFGSETWLAPS